MKVKQMSANQEIKLLRQLKNAKMLSAGSSRLVFVHPQNKNAVVKVAVGVRSLCQNKLEVRMWKRFASDHLAEIYEYGRFIIIMERAELTFDRDSFYDDCFLTAEDEAEGERTVKWLDAVLGETSDNYQIGQMNDGRFAAYDYGFNPDIRARSQCGWAEEIEHEPLSIRDYLDNAILLLRNKTPITKIDQWTQHLRLA